MSLVVETDPIPLMADADGVVRVGKTRVTLDTVVAAFRDGLTAEAMVEQYPSLSLDQVYSVIGYYLRHLAQVEAYLQGRELQAAAVRKENEAMFNPVGLRSRLLARR